MALYVDDAFLPDVDALAATYPIAGVTTNPSILLAAMKRGQRLDDLDLLRALLGLCPGPVFMQPTAPSYEELRAAALRYAEADPARVTLKLPMSDSGLRLARELRMQRLRFAFTACYSLAQAYCSALAGAEWIIPYFGRLRRAGADPCQRIADMARLLSQQQSPTRILAASLKSATDVIDVTLAGAQDCTVPSEVIRTLDRDPLTEAAIAQFAADWEQLQDALLEDGKR